MITALLPKSLGTEFIHATCIANPSVCRLTLYSKPFGGQPALFSTHALGYGQAPARRKGAPRYCIFRLYKSEEEKCNTGGEQSPVRLHPILAAARRVSQVNFNVNFYEFVEIDYALAALIRRARARIMSRPGKRNKGKYFTNTSPTFLNAQAARV